MTKAIIDNVFTISRQLVVELLLKIPQMVYLKVVIESHAVYKVFVADTSEYWYRIHLKTVLLQVEIICDERVIFEADGNELSISTDVKAKRLTIVIFALESQRHLQ